MQKVEPGVVWTNLLKNSSKVGKEVINEEFVAEIHEKLAHLCSENEVKKSIHSCCDYVPHPFS